MKRTIVLLTAILLLAGISTAQQQQSDGLLNTVIVTSANSTQDSLVATGPAKKLGVPIVHTHNNTVPISTKNSLNTLQPSNIVIVGGPEAVSSELESELAEYATSSTTRLWDMSSSGTSVATSEYYWPEGSNEVGIVHTSNGEQTEQLLRLVEETENEKPILISEGDNISASILGEIDRLRAQQATIYTDHQQLDTSRIENLGVQTEVRQNTDSISADLKQNQVQQIANDIGSNDTLILAAGQETGDIVTLPYLTELYVFGIPDETQIGTAVGLVQQVETTDILVTGGPELVNDVQTIVESSTGKQISVLEGTPIEIIDQIIQTRLSSILSTQQQLYSSWEQELQSSTQLQISAERQIEETRNILGSDADPELQSLLEQAQQAYEQQDYFEARRLALQASSQARIASYIGELPSAENQNETGILE
jgi:hypothetical protein